MCGSKFLTRTKLLLHMQTHGVILVPCQTCGDKFMSQIELQTHINQVHKHRSGKKAAPMPRRKPGPASKTNAPADKRGSTSLPTYLQLTQVSRRSSLASIKSEVESKSSGGAMDVIAKLLSAAASKQVTSEERPTCNFCPLAFKGQAELSAHLVNDHFKGLVPQIQMAQPQISSEKCPNCPRTFATKDHLESHVKTVHRAKQIRRSLGLDGQVFRRPCPKRMKTHYYNHDQDQHQKETDELRPSLLAARSDAAQAAKEAQELARKEEELKTTIIEEAKEAMKLERMNEERELKMELEQMQAQAKAQAQADQEDVRYEPITEDFMFEDMVISPCYVVLPHVSEEEVDAACNPPEELESDEMDDYFDDEAPLTIDESIVDDEPELPRSPIKGSADLIPEEILRNRKAYNAEDINEDGKDGGYYPAMADYSLPFSMANIWKKKADELGNFNAIEHLALMEKIEQMQKYNGSVVYSGSPSPPPIPLPALQVNGSHEGSPKKAKGQKQAQSPHTPKEKKFVGATTPGASGGNGTPVADYENQIKNDIWPLDCIKCNSLIGNLDNFNLHMNDHWSDDKCCPVCGLLINSKRFNFKQHLKIHTGEKPFTCNICNRSFRQKAHMVKHVTTHRTMPNGTSPPLALEAK